MRIAAGFSSGKRRADLKLSLYVDGASKGNPGRASVGAVVTDAGGNVLSEIGRTIGRATNNQAEYRALLVGLDEVDRVTDGRLDKVTLTVRSDSELLCKQMRGEYKIKNKALIGLSAKARDRLRLFASYSLVYIPREENVLADRLAQRALAKSRRKETFSLDEKVKS